MSITEGVSKAVYTSYEKRLFKEIVSKSPPKHIGIIMDGNRRFAHDIGLDTAEGHVKGKDKIREVLYWCHDIGVKYLTIYAFSTENRSRSPEELDDLMKLFINSFRDAGDDPEVHEFKIKMRAIGRIDSLPDELKEAIRYAEERTKDYNDFIFNIAIAYGGREEILLAIKKVAQEAKEGKVKVEDINEKMFESYLYTAGLPDPDMILRTSGEVRISNFLLWQLAYSELFFLDVYWPAFRKIDFLRAVREYQRRTRRFGK